MRTNGLTKFKIMKKLVIILLVVVFISTTAFVLIQQNVKTEASNHPKIENAIKELQSAVDYMEKAPHDFGGYKAQAIADSKKAIESLKLALKYRAKVDNAKK
jgi:cell shape-determining protein MreC